MSKLNKDELANLVAARNEHNAQAEKDWGLDTPDKRIAYAATCTESASALLIASLDEEGYHLTSKHAVRYRASETGDGTLFLAGRNDIYLQKDFLEAQGYTEEQGWPLAISIAMFFPAIATAEKPAPVEKPARKTQADEKVASSTGFDPSFIKLPKRPWSMTSAKARTVIRDAAEELMSEGIAEEDARNVVIGILQSQKYLALE